MIPESTLRQIAEHSISAESRALAAELLATREELAKQRRHINRPQYEAMRKERDDANAALRRMVNTHAAVVAEREAARADNERLAKVAIEPRPWWSVFGLERSAASRMHVEARSLGPVLVEMSLQHLADDTNKRGIHPAEIARAFDEARAELLAEQPKPAGGGA